MMTPELHACYRKNGHVFRVDGIRDGMVEAARSSASEPEKRAVRFSFGLAVWERYMKGAEKVEDDEIGRVVTPRAAIETIQET